MRLPLDPREEARRLAAAARERLPVTVRPAGPVGDGLAAFDDAPCARIPVWRPAAPSAQEPPPE
jgi:hypothetical protein